MRMAAGGALVTHAATLVSEAAPLATNTVSLLSGVVGVLLMAGLWTPATALLAACAAAWIAISTPGDAALWFFVFVNAISLALLGPGAWSIDARLFGWKRIDVHDEGEGDLPPD